MSARPNTDCIMNEALLTLRQARGKDLMLSLSKHEVRDNQSTFPRSRITRLPPRLAGRRDFETKPAVGLAQGRLGGGGIVGPGEDEA